MESSDRVIVAYVSTSCSRPGRSSSGTRAQHTSSALPISSAATRAMISSLSCVSVSILTCLAVIGTEGGHCPREPQGHMEESDPRAQGDTEEPIAGSRHPAENRPRRSWRNRRQQAAATPDFPPRTGVTAGIPGAEKRKVGGSTPPLTTSYGLVLVALTSANAEWALSRVQSPSDHDCPPVTVVGRLLSHADRTPRLRGPRIAASSCTNPCSKPWAGLPG